MQTIKDSINNWSKNRIKSDQVEKYLNNGKDFIPDDEINEYLRNSNTDKKRIRDIMEKSFALETLDPSETAALINVKDKDILAEMENTAAKIKKKVYDNRIVTFAPLYMSNSCINDCLYCGFRAENVEMKRHNLSINEVKNEIKVLAGKIGHKRLIIVYGEHPSNDINYMIDTIKAIYSVKVKTKNAYGEIRRVNVNAPPLSIEDLKKLSDIGIGTYQVFQETYHHDNYKKMHPKGPVKSDYRWRLYNMHRAFESGIDDVGIGALFGLYDWRFEVMGLLYHARELEDKFGIGPHTVSFPRLEPAFNTPFIQDTAYKVSDDDFKKLIVILRLSIPYTGLILTARESAQIRREVLDLGITQTDASSKIGIGSYTHNKKVQEEKDQQFLLGDTRSLDDVIRELAESGYITSFCTAGYRCGRTGKNIMELLKTGQEGKFCKLNAVLTFREWLDDFASEKTKIIGEKIIKQELKEIEKMMPDTYSNVKKYYERIKKGERDLYF